MYVKSNGRSVGETKGLYSVICIKFTVQAYSEIIEMKMNEKWDVDLRCSSTYGDELGQFQ